jgi:hypothetical protein
MPLRPELVAVVESVVASGASRISLDALSEAIGAMAIALEEIELLISEIESRGITVGDDAPPAMTHLPQVLGAARTLRAEFGRTPTSSEIAERSGLRVEEVRVALFAVTILQR